MPPRDEKLPLAILKRVTPRVEVPEVPHDPTLLETLTQSFYDAQAQTNAPRDMKDDGKRR